MKVLLEIEGGFTKEIFEGDKAEVTFFARGWKDVVAIMTQTSSRWQGASPEALAKETLKAFLEQVLDTAPHAWIEGCKARLANSKGKLKVVD